MIEGTAGLAKSEIKRLAMAVLDSGMLNRALVLSGSILGDAGLL